MEAELIEEQELLEYECSDGSQVIIATSEEVMAAAGCDFSAFAQGQIVEVVHDSGSGNIILQANFTTSDGTPLHNGLINLTEHRTEAVEEAESDPESNPNQCRSCGIAFNSKKTLKLHSSVHVDEAYYACEFCSASEIHWTEMWLHQCSNTDSVPIVCPQCHKTVPSKKQLQVHEEVHDLQRRFTSKRMEGYFKKKLQDVEENVVDWGSKPFICGVCGKLFGKMYEVEYHEKLHTGERETPNKCDKCGITYINRHDLNKHTALGCVGELSRKTKTPLQRRQPEETYVLSEDIKFQL